MAEREEGAESNDPCAEEMYKRKAGRTGGRECEDGSV